MKRRMEFTFKGRHGELLTYGLDLTGSDAFTERELDARLNFVADGAVSRSSAEHQRGPFTVPDPADADEREGGL